MWKGGGGGVVDATSLLCSILAQYNIDYPDDQRSCAHLD